MPMIQISDETFTQLQELAEALVDTSDTVIQRLLREHQSNQGGKSPHRRTTPSRQRAKKGEKTPNEAFYGPIIKALRDSGGRMATADAVDRVGELMSDRLNDVDQQPLKSGELRWRNTVRFARNDLVTRGKLADDSDFGFWELADEEG